MESETIQLILQFAVIAMLIGITITAIKAIKKEYWLVTVLCIFWIVVISIQTYCADLWY